MRKLMIAAGTLFALAATSSTASAQWNSNRVINSGNGAFNTIQSQNFGGGGFGYPGGWGGGVNKNVIVGSGNGVGNVINAQNFGGGWGGGVNKNVIVGSGNGVGNVINVRNR
jgi:hypothetical protein